MTNYLKLPNLRVVLKRFNYALINQGVGNPHLFIEMFKQRGKLYPTMKFQIICV